MQKQLQLAGPQRRPGASDKKPEPDKSSLTWLLERQLGLSHMLVDSDYETGLKIAHYYYKVELGKKDEKMLDRIQKLEAKDPSWRQTKALPPAGDFQQAIFFWIDLDLNRVHNMQCEAYIARVELKEYDTLGAIFDLFKMIATFDVEGHTEAYKRYKKALGLDEMIVPHERRPNCWVTVENETQKAVEMEEEFSPLQGFGKG